MDARYDLAAIGNYTKDTIVTPAGTRHVDGGGFNYAAFAAAALGLRVVAVTRLAAEDARVLEALRHAGVDVLATTTPTSSLMRLEYPTMDPDRRVLTMAATAGSFTAAQMRDVQARAFVVSPSVREEVPVPVLRELSARAGALVAADAQGFIRVRAGDGRLEHREWPEGDEVLPLLDVLKVDVVEARFLAGEETPARAAAALADRGPREVVLTHGGGVLVHAGGRTYEAPFRSGSMVGRSGRGDTCLGSYAAARLSLPPAEAVVLAAAVTSLKMEAEGPLRRSREEIEAFMRNEYATARG